MRRLALIFFCVLSSAAWARAWKGIDPGTSTRADVIEKFGPPSRTVKSGDKEILAYLGKQAIKGTTQTQFKVDPKTGVVERIDVFPGPKIDKAAIENSYGKACPPGPLPDSPCYLKKVTDDFRVYFHYPRLGLAIFFNPDGVTVNSFIFQPPRLPAKK
ncbi:MAG: hypothetical protein IRZ16_13220 [Myxococcaceae bacterium]|nr:hypothetical protein [Myxococcaceae bacterium]